MGIYSISDDASVGEKDELFQQLKEGKYFLEISIVE